MGEEGIQMRLMQGLRTRIGSNESLVKWLAAALDIDVSLASRKVNGSVGLNLSQLEILIECLPQVLENLLPAADRSQVFVGNYSQFRSSEEIEEYLLTIIKNFEIANKKGAHLKYLARDLPLFYFFLNKEMSRFKFSMWTGQLRNSGLQTFRSRVFDLCREITALYQDLPSTEMWSTGLMSNQRMQIQWYRGLGVISEKERDQLLDVFGEVLDVYQDWAQTGNKQSGTFDLYATDFDTMNSGGLLKVGKSRQLMTALSGVFFITSANLSLVNSFESQFDAQLSTATLLSKSNALSRSDFFKGMKGSLEFDGVEPPSVFKGF
jgi:hypothetical protein